MSTEAVETSVSSSIVVDAPIERAFSVFTEGIGTWFPPEYNLLDVEIEERVFEPREGGRVYDRGADGSECSWARVLAYEPPDRVVISWDISPQWQIEPTPRRRARSRCASPPSRPVGPESSSSIATSIAMARAGSRSANPSPATADGPGASGRSQSASLPDRRA